MASNHCKWIPNAPNGKQSKLFKDINDHFHDRKMTRKLWAFTTLDIFKEQYPNIEKDENGEPTYEALDKALNLKRLFGKAQNDQNRAMDMGLVDRNGKPTVFENADAALSQAEEFNKTAESKICVVKKTADGKYETDVQDNTALNIAEADKNKARRELNTALIKILQKIGFNVEFADNPAFYGVFDPLLAENNATNLKTVIQIANGEKGLDALPEEVCHLIMAGLKNHALKQRLDATMTDSVVRRVLGDEYDAYKEKYKNSNIPVEDMLRDEAEGRLLYQSLIGNDGTIKTVPTQQRSGILSLLNRIWNLAKSAFRKTSVADIDNAFVNAQNAILPISEMVKSGEIDTILDREDILSSQTLYHLADDIKDTEQLAQDGETMLSKKLYIMQTTAGNDPNAAKIMRQDINAVRDAIDRQHYASACYRILRAVTKDMTGILQELDAKGVLYSNSTDLNEISDQANLVERATIAVQAYEQYLEALERIDELIASGQVVMDKEWADKIQSDAKAISESIRNLKSKLGKLRFAVLEQLIKLYYGNNGEKPEGFEETDKYKWESADIILRQANKDIGFADTTFFSAGDSRNPLINVVHNIIVTQQAKRNNIINTKLAKMQEAQARLHAAGYSNDFVYDVDEKGNPTGYYKSDRNFAKYNKDREDFIASLDPEKFESPYEQQDAIEKWEATHTERVKVGNHFEYMPKLVDKAGNDMYIVRDFQKGWSKAQKDYYDDLIDMKGEMDEMLPGCMRNLFLAPQVRKSVTQMFDKNAANAWRTLKGRWKKQYAIVDDNEDYKKGVEVADGKGGRHVVTDFDEKEIQRVPVYFVHELDDMRDLSTDATRAMFNYICMSVNYSEMTKLASAMRLLKEHAENDYRIVQKEGGKPVIDIFRAFKRSYKREYTKKGKDTRTVRALEEYIDRQLFNDTKEKLGSTQIGNTGLYINWDILFNLFMRITSVGRMGFNVLSGITNATQGETQMITEAMANRFFNVKDLGWAKVEYNKLLLDYMGNFNSANRHDKMYMLINQFNSSEDFFRDMQDKDFNKSPMKRVLGRGNVYFLNTMGEHYLHTSGMLMILHHEKVRRLSDKKEVSLYDVIKQVHDKNGWHLELDDDIEFIDKNRAFLQNSQLASKNGIIKKSDRDALFNSLAVYINRINAGMHGGYSEAEKGNINRKAYGRAILQFRQWMFGMYNKNFAGRYFEASTGMVREGTYRTAWRWLTSTLWDLKNMSLKEAINHNHLSSAEKRNVRVALSQSALFVLLGMLAGMAGGWKDKDDRAIRLLAYQIKRLELETGALVPWPPTFIKNITTLVQSPAAGVKTLETISAMFDLNNYWDEVRGGRYKGWNKALRNVYQLTPIYNVHKIVDMKDYNYMFNIFK